MNKLTYWIAKIFNRKWVPFEIEEVIIKRDGKKVKRVIVYAVYFHKGFPVCVTGVKLKLKCKEGGILEYKRKLEHDVVFDGDNIELKLIFDLVR